MKPCGVGLHYISSGHRLGLKARLSDSGPHRAAHCGWGRPPINDTWAHWALVRGTEGARGTSMLESDNCLMTLYFASLLSLHASKLDGNYYPVSLFFQVRKAFCMSVRGVILKKGPILPIVKSRDEYLTAVSQWGQFCPPLSGDI